MSNKDTNTKPEEIKDSDLDQAAGGWILVESMVQKSDDKGIDGQNSTKGGKNVSGLDLGSSR